MAKVNQRTIALVFIVLIMATVLLSAMPSLLEIVVTAVHNLSDSMSTLVTTVGGPAALSTFFGNVDDYFLWGIAGGLVVFLIVLAFGIFKMGKGYYQKRYGGRRY